MAEKETKKTSFKLNTFLEKNRKVLLIVLIVVLVGIFGFSVYAMLASKSSEKALSAIDEISYKLTDGSIGLEESELEEKRSESLEALVPYCSKGGIVGVTANRLSAEIVFQKKEYENAISYWSQAALKAKNTYTAPLSYYNIAVCYEELDKVAEAEENYKKASDFDGFVLKSHALFSLGRIRESQEKYSEAAEAYKAANDSSPNDSWAKLAKTRLIDLKIQGKSE